MIRTMTFFLITALLFISCKDEPDAGEPDLASRSDAAPSAGDGATRSLCWDYCQEAKFRWLLGLARRDLLVHGRAAVMGAGDVIGDPAG